MSNNNLDYLNASQDQFEPPENENSLRQHSEKLVFSSRLFPEWIVAAYGIFRKKYPGTPIESASKLLQYIVQDYINMGFTSIGSRLPPTEDSIDFLIRQGYVNADSRSQFTKLSKASAKSVKFEEQAMSTDNLATQYKYWKDRDPEKAEAILNEMTQQVARDLSEKPQVDEKQTFTKDESPIDSDHKGMVSFDQFSKQRNNDEIAGADVPDSIPVKNED